MDGLFTRVPDGNSNVPHGLASNPYCIGLINKLEGYKTRLEELHWNALKKDLTLHRFIDECSKEVYEYQDDLAENLQSFMGVINVGDVVAILPTSVDLYSLLNELKQDIRNFELRYKAEPQFVGAININENAMAEIDRLIVLSLPWKCC